jgi:hypothetical protein
MRQQWNFTPPRTTTEVEEYRVELSDLTVLEMTFTPDIAGGAAGASLNNLAVYCQGLEEQGRCIMKERPPSED